jgi:hypothetical protein
VRWRRRQFRSRTSTLMRWRSNGLRSVWFQHTIFLKSYCKLSVFSYSTNLLTWFSSTLGLTLYPLSSSLNVSLLLSSVFTLPSLSLLLRIDDTRLALVYRCGTLWPNGQQTCYTNNDTLSQKNVNLVRSDRWHDMESMIIWAQTELEYRKQASEW